MLNTNTTCCWYPPGLALEQQQPHQQHHYVCTTSPCVYNITMRVQHHHACTTSPCVYNIRYVHNAHYLHTPIGWIVPGRHEALTPTDFASNTQTLNKQEQPAYTHA
ncbi:hypothetical protein BsWGS_23988 [Bradybaena similaris]